MPTERDPFELVPHPQVVRARIADNAVEGQALRKLLRIAEDVAEHRQRSGKSVQARTETSSQ
jgi:hypothetical protein